MTKPNFYKLHWTLYWFPSNKAIASDGRIFLADGYGSYFITSFDPDGKEITTFAGPSTQGTGLVHPHGCAVMTYQGQEVLAVTECQLSKQEPDILQQFAAESCIKLFTLAGDFITRLALDTLSPRHIRRLSNNRYAIPDFQGRILITDASLKLVRSIGGTDQRFKKPVCDDQVNMPRPHDCALLDEHQILVTDFTGCMHLLKSEATLAR